MFLCYTRSTYEKTSNAKIKHKKKKKARLSRKDAHAGRTKRAKKAPTQEKKSSLCMIGRLSRTYEYQQAYKEGLCAKGPALRVYLRPTVDETVKVGISVGRSVIRRATNRQRLKRIVRGCFLQNRDGIKHGCED